MRRFLDRVTQNGLSVGITALVVSIPLLLPLTIGGCPYLPCQAPGLSTGGGFAAAGRPSDSVRVVGVPLRTSRSADTEGPMCAPDRDVRSLE